MDYYMDGRRDDSVAASLLKGAIAGAAGVWAMDRVVKWMWAREDSAARQEERLARPQGLDPAHVMANRAAEMVGTELHPPQPHPAGIAVHYGLGIMPGALYGVLRHRVPGIAAGAGLLYGLALGVMEDELVNPLIGTSGKPGEYPWQAHLRGIVAHLVLGAATHATLEALDAAA